MKRLMLVAALAALPTIASAGTIEVERVPLGSTPLLRCTPGFQCEVVLESGEKIRRVTVGDGRWNGQPDQDGDTPIVLVTASQQFDVDANGDPTNKLLHTNMHISTDRRGYDVELVTATHPEASRVGFSYAPKTPVHAGTAAPLDQVAQVPAAALVPPALEDLPFDPLRLDFGWRIRSGTCGGPDRSIHPTSSAPIAAFSYGPHLWVKLPATAAALPTVGELDARGRDVGEPTFITVTGRYFKFDNAPSRLCFVSGDERSEVVRTHE